jgi:hypothetical protein
VFQIVVVFYSIPYSSCLFFGTCFRIYHYSHTIHGIPHSLCSITFKFVLCILFHFTMCHLLSFSLLAMCPNNMATVHAFGYSNLTIMVKNSRTILVFKQGLCTMFSFQLGSLHISKDISYDYNNLVLNSVY